MSFTGVQSFLLLVAASRCNVSISHSAPIDLGSLKDTGISSLCEFDGSFNASFVDLELLVAEAFVALPVIVPFTSPSLFFVRRVPPAFGFDLLGSGFANEGRTNRFGLPLKSDFSRTSLMDGSVSSSLTPFCFCGHCKGKFSLPGLMANAHGFSVTRSFEPPCDSRPILLVLLHAVDPARLEVPLDDVKGT